MNYRSLLLLVIMLPHQAFAECFNYDPGFCSGCGYMNGNSATFKINTNDFGSVEADNVADGAFAWNAGSGEILRGANWEFKRTNVTVDGTWGDGDNNVRMKSDSWFTNKGLGSIIGHAHREEGTGLDECTTIEVDITFRDSTDWTNKVPSNHAAGKVSIGQVSAHEFGHAFGLNHENTFPTLMNESYPNSGELGGAKYRINEDEYTLLVDGKSDSSTGKTLTLNKFERVVDGNTREVWDGAPGETGSQWYGCPGDTIDVDDGPSPIFAIILGTPTVSPKIEWRLDPGSTCFQGTEYVLGSRTPTLGANVPYEVSPNGGYQIPSGTPAGWYNLCAKIDSDDQITETSEADNVVRSDQQFEVESCP